MYQVIIVIHVLLGLGIIGLVMMQQGKGADAGAAFGTGSSGSVFGAQGAASFLSRTTAILAGLFFLTSLGLAILNSHKGVAYDLMSTQPSPTMVEQDGVLPDIDGVKTETLAPVVVPEIKAEKVELAPNKTVETPVNTVGVKPEVVVPKPTATIPPETVNAVIHGEKTAVTKTKTETHEKSKEHAKHTVAEKHPVTGDTKKDARK